MSVNTATDGHVELQEPRWIRRLRQERALSSRFEKFTESDWRSFSKNSRLLNENYDTVVSLDWPHYCGSATTGCGGVNGWCYTLTGQIAASRERALRAGINDVLATRFPILFAEIIDIELTKLTMRGSLPDRNLRYSGSGELLSRHVPALKAISDLGVRLWGFSKNISVASELKKLGISVLFSCDATTQPEQLKLAAENGLRLAYTSTSISDWPPNGTFVTFPVHRSGKVREVVDVPSICPKVLDEFQSGKRRAGWCQHRCHRCHSAMS